jgi:Lon protease-like protein
MIGFFIRKSKGKYVAEVALFPIPNCVVFPGMIFPLHVFEPRYRAMIKHCLDHKLPVAICHTEKILHHTEHHEDLKEALSSNQDTYKPKTIFSAGQCELYETLEDGRMLINVHVDKRYKLNNLIQTLPFNIADCQELIDQPISDVELQKLEQLKDKVMHRLLALSSEEKDVQDMLRSPKWEDMGAQEFSFAIFGLIQMEPDVQQSALEEIQATERLQLMLNILNQQPY